MHLLYVINCDITSYTNLHLYFHESESESSDSTDVCIVPNRNSSDSETQSSNSETILDTHQGTSTTMNHNSEMEVQDGEANTFFLTTNTTIIPGTHSNLFKSVRIILVRTYFKHKVTKAAILSLCGLIAKVLKLIGHPLSLQH